MKYLSIIPLSFFVGACSIISEESYESGWNNEISEKTYAECSPVWLSKDIFVSQNINRLVKLDYLTKEQAERVKQYDIRVGDPECLAYAAYGLNRAKVTITTNEDGQLVRKGFIYSCLNSQVKCPGVEIAVVDGYIVNIRPLSK